MKASKFSDAQKEFILEQGADGIRAAVRPVRSMAVAVCISCFAVRGRERQEHLQDLKGDAPAAGCAASLVITWPVRSTPVIKISRQTARQ